LSACQLQSLTTAGAGQALKRPIGRYSVFTLVLTITADLFYFSNFTSFIIFFCLKKIIDDDI